MSARKARWHHLDPAKVLPAPPEEVYKLLCAGRMDGEAVPTKHQRHVVGLRIERFWWDILKIPDEKTAYEFLNALNFIHDPRSRPRHPESAMDIIRNQDRALFCALGLTSEQAAHLKAAAAGDGVSCAAYIKNLAIAAGFMREC